ncbi:type VII secretion target [Lentzea flava]|nr:type VII secretion target [Lentzea flava]MCP2203235.1 Excreted virulence factor EspC, type VII ESX diderm [Lentzea flava]
MSGFEVDPAALRAHADKADRHSAALGQAADAADQAMSDDVYGLICQFLPPLFNELEQTARDALKASRDGMAETALNLRHSAERYERHDNAVGERLTSIEGGLR